ncbi:hypothetical protein SCA6_000543 [Theobroma cacao]
MASSCFDSGYFSKNFFVYTSSGRLILLTFPSARGKVAVHKYARKSCSTKEFPQATSFIWVLAASAWAFLQHCESSFQHSHIKKVNEVTLEAILMLSRPKLVVS